MSVNMVRKSILFGVAVLFVLALGTCNSPMGMGPPIDWEAPVLTLDPTPNPMYVRYGAKLSGTVTDNIAVSRVILRDSDTGEQLFTATLLAGNRWEIALDFSEDQNGETILADIVAYDTAGNSDANSIASITLIIDIRPPLVEDIYIQRTPSRTAYLESWNTLIQLEETDLFGERTGNMDTYQNGAFYINAKISESETRIVSVKLSFYDSREPNTVVLTLDPLPDSSLYTPSWLVSEEMLLDAGDLLWPGYRDEYNTITTKHTTSGAPYDWTPRYYYRARVTAYDRSDNAGGLIGTTDDLEIVEDLEYFCLWKIADNPKGILDPMVVGGGTDIIMTKGSYLPVLFFDDDRLEWGYTALFTKEQWAGTDDENNDVFIAPSFTLKSYSTDAAKFTALMSRLSTPSSTPVYNWRYDRYSDNSTVAESEPVINRIPPSGADEVPYFIVTGNDGSDYGEFVVVTMVKDKKQPPHDTVYGNADLSITKYRKYNVSLVDENAPLIVFDKTTAVRPVGSPEENTFPKLTNGETFEMHGYTLRENSSGFNQVVKFRLAWIPYGIEGGPDSHIAEVRKALELGTGFPPDVQWWDLSDEVGHNIEPDAIGIINYAKQPFSKTFNILGKNDPDKGYKHFHLGDKLENEIKTFIFYAEDNMGHVVFTQINLLGNKTPPDLKVYDTTGRAGLEGLEAQTPDINKIIEAVNPSGGIINDAVREAYQIALNGSQENIHGIMKTAVPNFNPMLEDRDRASSLQAYPRDTLLSYWVEAEESGGLEIVKITMKDNTYATSETTGFTGHFDPETRSLAYAETLPEVTQRTFLFEATDTLGNVARLQRTVTITNAAVLSEITTVTQSGKYPAGETIVLQARFSSQIRWTGTDKPLLNVRYEKGGIPQLVQIETSTPADTPVLFLSFPITVLENDEGMIETLYKNISGDVVGNDDDKTDRPITRPYNTFIVDNVRGDNAFLPGYSSGVEWASEKFSLQAAKKIWLDGVYPRISRVGDRDIVVAGKTIFTNNNYYFKADETITFTITATKPIETGGSGNPRIAFVSGGVTSYAKWERSTTVGTTYTMTFTTPVTSDMGNGAVSNIRLSTTEGTIVDTVGNPLRAADGTAIPATLTVSNNIYIDKVKPSAPGVQVNSAGLTAASTLPPNQNYYTINPLLNIPDPGTGDIGSSGLDKREYSLNDGLSWVDWSTNAGQSLNWTAGAGTGMTINSSVDHNNSSPWILKTRYVNRAGAVGEESRHYINVNGIFPRLTSVSARQANNTYREGSRLDFDLAFADDVHTQGGTAATITLSNRSNDYSTTTPVPTYQITLNVTAVAAAGATSTLTFSWLPANFTGKEMLDGLYISAINFSSLRDRYANTGPTNANATIDTSTITISGQTSTNNLPEGLKVDCIAPTLSAMTPKTAQGTTTGATGTRADSVMATTGTDYNRVITLQFSEAVKAGTGSITIKPHGQYMIPPVFENDTYYLRVSDGVRASTPQSGYTKITGFYDIYNALPSTGTSNRTHLTAGSNMTNLITLDDRTGQSAGPYIRMTQGLKTGAGYSGNYHNNMNDVATYPEFYRATVDGTTNTPVGPNPIGSYMVPDTSTKWVLDYRYSINNGQNTQYVPATAVANPALATPSADVVTNIRLALTTAHFRWQELDVVATTQFSDDGINYPVNKNSGRYVKITLNEPLEKGLEWDLCYPAGTFTDVAGNPAAALNYPSNAPVGQADNASTHWFVSAGVQTPVIRVNRKSYDARTTGWEGTGRVYANPTNRGGTGGSSAGWGITDFNTVHFRIETETPNASLSYGKIDGRTVTHNGATDGIPIGSAYITTGAVGTTWNIAVPNGGTDGTNTTAYNWNGTDTTRGTFTRPNLIRRGATAAGYWAVVENGVVSRRDFNTNHYGFRSYNKDATIGDLSGLSLGITVTGSVSSGGEGNTDQNRFTYYSTEARKDYVAATAAVTYSSTTTVTSSRGYEGVFRSVVAMNMTRETNPLCVEGSNVKNGMPSISGFPVRDAEETGDNRFIKVFYNDGRADNFSRFLWVSTEIVSQWYFLKWGNGGTHQSTGEVNNYLTAGYGDLSFAHNVGSY